MLTSAVPTNPDEPVTRIFIFSNSLYFVRRGQKPSSLHATQPARNGQVIEIFKFYLANEEVESFVVIQSPSATRNGEALCHWPPPRITGYNAPVPPVSQTIRVKVLFFGRLKELSGHAEDSIEFADATTIEELFALYAARHPELAKFRSSVVASRNQEFAAWDTRLRSGDEVAFLPPVSGG